MDPHANLKVEVTIAWTFDALKEHLADVHNTVEEPEGVMLPADTFGYRPGQDLDSLTAIHDAEHEGEQTGGRDHGH